MNAIANIFWMQLPLIWNGKVWKIILLDVIVKNPYKYLSYRYSTLNSFKELTTLSFQISFKVASCHVAFTDKSFHIQTTGMLLLKVL